MSCLARILRFDGSAKRGSSMTTEAKQDNYKKCPHYGYPSDLIQWVEALGFYVCDECGLLGKEGRILSLSLDAK